MGQTNMDGNPKIFFQWQNPVLRESIYPFRKEKLRDFLRYYYEIDLVSDYKKSDQTDPALIERIRGFSTALQNEHQRLDALLEQAIADRCQTDKWFACITGSNEKILRFKRLYYLDRQVLTLTDRLADLVSRQESLSKRVDWYAEEDTRRNVWIQRAAELDAPVAQARAELQQAQKLRSLFDQQDRLPRLDAQGNVSPLEALHWEVLNYQKELDNLSHDELIQRVWDRFEQDPPRFEQWLRYMVIHFSGMRYRSAHGSWADPKFLLELLTRESMRVDIQQMDDQALLEACQEAVSKLEDERHNLTDPSKIHSVDQLIAKLNFWNPRRALLDFYMARQIGEIQILPDDERIILGQLEDLRKRMQAYHDSLPDWVWSEITKYTQLRLKTQEKDWESISPERWKAENWRWREILDAWERKDITGWRKQHEETLQLIVTRAVCNEIAEHIQHLRGLVPFAGLASKPKWYINWQNKTKNEPPGNGSRAYLVQAPREEHFVNGASILWLDWVDRQPNAWQIAMPLPGYNIPPGDIQIPRSKTASTVEWSFHQVGSSFIRTRRKPTIHELREQGRSEREIDAIRDEMRRSGGFVQNYLRWTHEATVIGVVEMLEGKFVLTFETGQIGVVQRRLTDLVGNPKVFVGFIPASQADPDELADMLDPQKILANGTT
jgi:hypothetical protein